MSKLARVVQLAALGSLSIVWLVGGLAAAQQTPPAAKVEVRVGVHLLDVTRIDEVASTYDMEGYLTLGWRDPRLAHGDAEPLVYEHEAVAKLLQESGAVRASICPRIESE